MESSATFRWRVRGGHLPIGISFFTFQAVAYVVDVAKGMEVSELKRFALFYRSSLSWLQDPLSGPKSFTPVEAAQVVAASAVSEGLYRIAVGFIKSSSSQIFSALKWSTVLSWTLQLSVRWN